MIHSKTIIRQAECLCRKRLLKAALVMLLAASAAVGTTQAKMLRVNNDGSIMMVPGLIYPTIQAAINDASPGDTIHVEGSIVPYKCNDFKLEKRVLLIGPGYLLNLSPMTQYKKEPAKLEGKFYFAPGSEGSVMAGFVQIDGPTSATSYQIPPNPMPSGDAIYSGDRIIINADSITIFNCKFFWVEMENKYNDSRVFKSVTIRKCFFNPGVVVARGTQAKKIESVTITNCFFRNSYSASTNWKYHVIDFRGDNNTSNVEYRVKSAYIANNTFFHSFKIFANSTTFAGNAFVADAKNNDLIVGDNNTTILSKEKKNVSRCALSAIAVSLYDKPFGEWFATPTLLDGDISYMETNASSPLYADGNTINKYGMYGGADPYVPSGMYKIPSVYDIVMDDQVGDSFDMTIKASVH